MHILFPVDAHFVMKRNIFYARTSTLILERTDTYVIRMHNVVLFMQISSHLSRAMKQNAQEKKTMLFTAFT